MGSDIIMLTIVLILLSIIIWAVVQLSQPSPSVQNTTVQPPIPVLIVNNTQSNRDMGTSSHPPFSGIINDLTIGASSMPQQNRLDSNYDLLKRYCSSWNYNYTETSPDLSEISSETYILYLNDPVTDINIHRSLAPIILLGGNNINYIAFNQCKSYIIKQSSAMSRHSEQIPIEANFLNSESIPKIINSEIKSITSSVHNILAEGYPCLTKNGILLHSAYLHEIFQNRTLPFKIPEIIPDIIRSRIQGTVQNIPKVIHQTFQTHGVPNNIAQAIYSWVNHNPDYEYRYYAEHDRKAFITKHFDVKVLAAYNSLIPGAYKADLWRYCVIYINGGVYIDVKMGSLVPLNSIIDSDTDLVIINDTHDGTIYNAFFAAAPRHPAILKTIDVVVNRILKKEYGSHILYPTGPLAMGHAILPLYGFTGHAHDGKHIIKDENERDQIIQVYSHRTRNRVTNVIDIKGEDIIKTRHTQSWSDENYIHKITGLPHYRILWNKKAIYHN
ncbi:Hypothetical protein HVR_LOCUS456 [uncultured virus]|nr:Hypothetical protein HVR_LOCUS456 [uncultured virus]